MAALDEMRLGDKRHKVIEIAIEAAMDHKPSHREMTSVLISELTDEIVSSEDIAKAFEILLGNLSDLILDTPDAPTILGNFIARAVADDCFSSVTVHSWKEKANDENAKAALAHAEALLVDKLAMLRLNNVWGVGGGAQPVKALSRRMYMLLEEFLSSQDATEASRCLRELEVPHFHHELVYEAIVMAIEAMQENVEESICRLLKSLFNSCLVTPDQMKRGFLRVFEDLPDICLDVPAAYALIDRFVTRAQRHGFIGEDVVRQVPTRGRKRFVSEGDGGKVKEDTLDN
jgi:programmed cell death protein 4